jgi:hypothetical protein
VSTLEGQCRGQTVSFLKTYQGTSFRGFKVGDQLVGMHKEDHRVHYEGQLGSDGQLIEGRWWIDVEPPYTTHRTEGLFVLRRGEEGCPVSEEDAREERKQPCC